MIPWLSAVGDAIEQAHRVHVHIRTPQREADAALLSEGLTGLHARMAECAFPPLTWTIEDGVWVGRTQTGAEMAWVSEEAALGIIAYLDEERERAQEGE